MRSFIAGILCAVLLTASPWVRAASPGIPTTGLARGVTPDTPTLNSDRVALSGHILPALSAAQPVVTTMAASLVAEPLTLTVVLRRSNPAGFENYLRDVYDPQSPQYRKFLSPEEVSDRFGPSQADYDAVRTYFEQQGFTVAEGSANRMTLTISGTRATAKSALGVTINDYQLGERKFHANDSDPSLPKSLASRVEAVVGFSNLAMPQPMNEALPSNDAARALWYGLCMNAAINGGSSALTGGLLLAFPFLLPEITIINLLLFFGPTLDFLPPPIQNTTAYSLMPQYFRCVNDYNTTHGYGAIPGYGTTANPLSASRQPNAGASPPPPAWQGADGTGQTVGLLEFDTFQLSDVSDYIRLMGLSPNAINNLSQVHINGGATPGSDQSEVLLNIANIMTGAPGAKIVVYDAPFTGPNTSFQALFNAMINDGVDIISNSWGYCEDQTTLADVQSIDTILQSAAASGISVFTASGDTGSTCLNGSANTATVPASSPHITAVGGTSLTIGPGFTYVSETWWDGSSGTPPTGQGGFGVSRFFSRPSYQDGSNPSAMRSLPDVSANADPAKGVFICQASDGGCPTGKFYGGTSSSAPTWAAFAALLNQTQGSNLGFLNPLIYPFANTDAFHNGASMGSDFAHVGLGSPNLALLHQRLTGQTTGPVSPAVSYVKAYLPTTYAVPDIVNLPLPNFADGTSPSYVVVTLADANGNVVAGKTVTLKANAGSHAVITPASGVSPIDHGAVVFTVTDATIETVIFTATVTTDGVTLTEMPQIVFGPPLAAAGGISANPTSVSNNGASTTTITVTLKDAQNRPSPGKLITLSQGSGHSVITGPSPSVTDANGQIQFVATNQFSETVIYTAVDVTDGNLPVPGSASVTFSGSATQSCVGAPPTAANGYTLTPFANGFFAQDFFFGNVNWGGCPGASNPTFDTTGSVFIANFRTGGLYKMGSQGGVASDELANLGQTLGPPVFGKDGRLYATHGATTGGFTTGDIVEIDPATGAQLRVVAANLTCPNGLSVDPLSGDLFFDDSCSGAGSDNPSLFRVRNLSGATPTVEVYATLPTTAGNGAISFAPDGTIYVVTNYFTYPNAPVVRIDGTNKPSPTITPLGLNALYWVTVGEVRPDGSAKSLIVLSGTDPNFALALVDITTNPFTSTPLTDGAIGSGVIGPDGCLYASASDTVYKLAPSTGGCGFATTNPSPALILSPATVSPNPAQGSQQTMTAEFVNLAVPADTPVFFNINGANWQSQLARTDASGKATLSYTGTYAGSDTVVASATVGTSNFTSNPARLTWVAGTHTTFLSLNTSPTSSTAGTSVMLAASLFDVSVNPTAAISGASIQFTVGSQSCSGATNASGVASCTVTLPTAGSFTLTANYAGTAQFVPASASQAFFVVAPSTTPPPCFTGTLSGGGQATACIIDAPPACQFTNASFVSVASTGVPPPTGIQIPYGLFQFTATGCGSSITLSLTYPAALPANTSYWKFGPTAVQSAHWYPLAAPINGSTLTVTLTDGGTGDSDLQVNGSIVDPGGAGYAVAADGAASIPTLDEWRLALFVLLMAIASVVVPRLRRTGRL